MGWGGFLFSLIACGVLVWDRVAGKGKATADIQNDIKDLCGKIEDMEGRLEVVDGLTTSVRELVFEWRGVDGNNGYKSIIKHDHLRIDAIEKADSIIEAVKKARDEDEQRSGGLHRRKSERELNNLIPEEREERG